MPVYALYVWGLLRMPFPNVTTPCSAVMLNELLIFPSAFIVAG